MAANILLAHHSSQFTVIKNSEQGHINLSSTFFSLTPKRGDEMANNLFQEISMAQTGDKPAMLRLLEKFSPLIRRYSYLLNYEDANSDLTIALIELIRAIHLPKMNFHDDKYFVGYIRSSIYHSYILLSKKLKYDSIVSPVATLGIDDEESASNILENLLSQSDEYLQIEFDFLFNILTNYEAKIVIYFVYYQFTVKEIAAIFHVSLPAITQAKRNAFKKLKKNYQDWMGSNYGKVM